MPTETTFFSRIGEWFKTRGADGRIPVEKEIGDACDSAEAGAIEPVRESRLSFLKPWGRRDAALTSLQRGFDTLTELMTVIRDNLEEQGRRQDEVLSHMAQMPEVLKSVPEAQRMQAETLKAIGQQLQNQIKHQDQLAEILSKVSQAAGDQRKVLEDLHGRVDGVAEHHDALTQSLKQVGTAIQTMGHVSESSTQTLKQMQEDMSVRKGEIERILQRQDTRVTVMLGAAMVLSATALVTVIVVGLLLLRRPAQLTPPALIGQPAQATLPAKVAEPTPALQITQPAEPTQPAQPAQPAQPTPAAALPMPDVSALQILPIPPSIQLPAATPVPDLTPADAAPQANTPAPAENAASPVQNTPAPDAATPTQAPTPQP